MSIILISELCSTYIVLRCYECRKLISFAVQCQHYYHEIQRNLHSVMYANINNLILVEVREQQKSLYLPFHSYSVHTVQEKLLPTIYSVANSSNSNDRHVLCSNHNAAHKALVEFCSNPITSTNDTNIMRCASCSAFSFTYLDFTGGI